MLVSYETHSNNNIISLRKAMHIISKSSRGLLCRSKENGVKQERWMAVELLCLFLEIILGHSERAIDKKTIKFLALFKPYEL